MVGRYGPHNPDETYVPHRYPEQLFDTGEVLINYATAGETTSPALLLIPGQTESWWGYEAAMDLLKDDFQIFAVDLRGQGRSGRTPGRYTLDNMGADLVRVMQGVIGRPTIVSGLSSGGVLSAWLSAYAPPGLVRGAHYEDPPLFTSEVSPACGPSIKQGIGPIFAMYAKYLGDQWDVGDWKGLVENAPNELHPWMVTLRPPSGAEPPQNLKEYDPEWARAFWTGSVAANCDHQRMLRSVKVPVLFTHHFRMIDEAGLLRGAISDLQAGRVRELVEGAGRKFDYRSFPQMGHSMHGQDPKLFADTLSEWVRGLAAGE
ncbi:MAG TPA: alpha/beta hydrolase [Caulobacteraceae bacterium]|jgi:pimeloyl-ACP methyl ester carboxylesterase